MDSFVRLNCAGTQFGSYLDEKHLFAWSEEISCFERWDGDTLVVRTHDMSEVDLRDILALFWRYQMPMRQLAQFLTERNQHWLAEPSAYWHERVFGAAEVGSL
jgi:hypothetical protein